MSGTRGYSRSKTDTTTIFLEFVIYWGTWILTILQINIYSPMLTKNGKGNVQSAMYNRENLSESGMDGQWYLRWSSKGKKEGEYLMQKNRIWKGSEVQKSLVMPQRNWKKTVSEDKGESRRRGGKTRTWSLKCHVRIRLPAYVPAEALRIFKEKGIMRFMF